MKNSRGFTLIELTIVVTIIALLSSIVLVSLGESRQKARDANRLADMQQLRTALELYHSNTEVYPGDIGTTYATPGTCGVTGTLSLSTVLGSEYIPSIPTDPLNRCYLYYRQGNNFRLLIQPEDPSLEELESCYPNNGDGWLCIQG